MNRTYHLSDFVKNLEKAVNMLERNNTPVEVVDSVKYAYSLVDSDLAYYGDKGEITMHDKEE